MAGIIEGLIVSLLQNGAYDAVKAGFKSFASLEAALHRAAKQAEDDFFKRFGDEFGTPRYSFLARGTNWDLILRSLLYREDTLSVDSLDPQGFGEVKPASKEALEYFVQCITNRIQENHSLDQHFIEKDHVQQQTEVVERIKRVDKTLLDVRDEGRQDTQNIMQAIESVRVSVNALDVGRDKGVAYEAIDEQIDFCRDFIASNNPSAAISCLEKLRAKKWETLPDRQRFRIVTNIAAAKLRLGSDFVGAAQELLQAEKLAPTDIKALVNSATAHWLLDNPTAARKKAEEAVRLFPDDAEAYKTLILTLDGDENSEDPLPLIPAELLSSPELCLQLGGFFLRKNNPVESRKWFKRAYELGPTNMDIREQFATCLLEELLSDNSIVTGRQMTDAQRKEMIQARDILADLWSKTKDTEVSGRHIPSVINLCNAERLLDNPKGAMALIEEAIHRHPGQVQLQKQYYFCLSSEGRMAEACEILKDMPDDAFEEKLLVEGETLAEIGRLGEGLVKIEAFLSKHQSLDNDLRTVLAKASRVRMMAKMEGLDTALASSQQLAEDCPSIIEYHLLVSDLLAQKGDKAEAIEWAHKALVIANAKGEYLERFVVAETLAELGLHREAASVYKELMVSYEDSRNLRRLLSCYLAGDLRAEALDLVSHLPEKIKGLRFYGRACAELYYRLGELPTARKFLKRCLKDAPTDLEMRLNYITLLERMEEKNDARKVLEEVPEGSDGSPGSFVGLAHAYARYGMEDKALRVGYEALHRFNGSASVHLGYCSLILNAIKKNTIIDQVRKAPKVGVDTAFTCVTQAGKTLTYIIDTGAAKDAQEEITPENPIAKKAIGHAAGETFVILETPMGSEKATILEVKHKYLHALHETMNSFQYRFPDVPAMWMFSLSPSPDGGLDLQPMLEMISQRSHAVENAEEIYSKGPVPLALVAHQLGTNPIDCMLGISQGGRVPVKCCLGSSEERSRARLEIQQENQGFIIDPFSLYTLHCLGFLGELLTITKGNLGVTQSTLDFFAEIVEERKTMQPFMTVSKEQGQYLRAEVSEEDIKGSLKPFEIILSWCREHCVLIPAVGKPGANEDAKLLFSKLHPVFLDTLLAASGTGRLLISEDLHYRQVAEHIFEVNGVWAQPLLQVTRDMDLISDEKYSESIFQLVNMNFSFVSISAFDLLHQLSKTDFVVGKNFCKMMDTVSAREAGLIPSLNVLSILLCAILQRGLAKSKMEKITYATLTRLAANPAAPPLMIVVSLYKFLGRKMVFEGAIAEEGLEFYNQTFGAWCVGHFVQLSRRGR